MKNTDMAKDYENAPMVPQRSRECIKKWKERDLRETITRGLGIIIKSGLEAASHRIPSRT